MYTEREKPFRYSKYLSLWLQVVFYSFGLTVVAYLIKPETVGLKLLLEGAFPVLNSRYWYFEAYTALFFLIPWLNKFIRRCNQRELSLLMLISFLIFSCYGNLTRISDGRFGMNNGYSFLWLAMMYLAGAWMKKYNLIRRVRKGVAAWGFGICTAATWLYTLIFRHGALLSYISPTIVLMSVSLMILFADLRFGERSRKLLRRTAPAAFGVYLVHLQQIVYLFLLPGAFVWIADAPVWAVPLLILGCAAAVFLVSLLVEMARMRIFALLKINETAEKLWARTGRRILRSIIRRLPQED